MAENKRPRHKVIYARSKKFHLAFDDGLQIKDTQATRHRMTRSQLLVCLREAKHWKSHGPHSGDMMYENSGIFAIFLVALFGSKLAWHIRHISRALARKTPFREKHGGHSFGCQMCLTNKCTAVINSIGAQLNGALDWMRGWHWEPTWGSPFSLLGNCG